MKEGSYVTRVFSVCVCPSPPTAAATENSRAELRPLPVTVSRAIAALRCLPCLVGSFAVTEASRREAVGSALGVVDDLLKALSVASPVGDNTAGGIENGAVDEGAHGSSASKRERKRRKKQGKGAGVGGVHDGDEAATMETAGGGGGGGEHRSGGCLREKVPEATVARAYALEAGVGLCCLLPAAADAKEKKATREETFVRLVGWHDR